MGERTWPRPSAHATPHAEAWMWPHGGHPGKAAYGLQPSGYPASQLAAVGTELILGGWPVRERQEAAAGDYR
jgi:hypothetical protein